MKKIFFPCSLFILLLSACSKKDRDPSKTELISSGTWALTAVVSDNDGNGTYETDDFSAFGNCFKDNYYSFLATGQAEMNEGPTKCDPLDPQTETSTWLFTQNETHLKIDSDEYVLIELTASTLKWKEEYAGGRSTLVTMSKR